MFFSLPAIPLIGSDRDRGRHPAQHLPNSQGPPAEFARPQAARFRWIHVGGSKAHAESTVGLPA